jgi:tripartite-type tricarboxylate transporter receptor subunit TctC
MRLTRGEMKCVLALLGLACAAIAPTTSWSQSFPVKPVRIVTAEPGGGNELAARILAQELTTMFGQQVIVESRGGASGAIAAQTVSKAPPDGYTWLIYSNSLWVLPLIKEVPWDVLRDFAPVALLAQAPSLLVVHPSLPARSVAELVKLARARRGELNYSSGATGSSGHLAAELFKLLTKTDIVRVRYKGTGPGLVAAASGEVQIMFPAAGSIGATRPRARSAATCRRASFARSR